MMVGLRKGTGLDEQLWEAERIKVVCYNFQETRRCFFTGDATQGELDSARHQVKAALAVTELAWYLAARLCALHF